jgi:Zn2+/Cd2+-exporting ATPase
MGGSWLTWIHRALVLLVVACPCALVIATPVAMVSALSAAARRGLLLKGGAVLERLAATRIVALDKTGTLSEGRLRIVSLTALGELSVERALQLAASLETGVHHPIAEAIVAHATALALPCVPASGVQHLPGRGATALIDGHRVRIGRPSWLREVEPAASVPDEATAVLMVDGVASLAVVARDQPRPSAAAAVTQLRRLVDEVVVVSGDQHAAVQELAARIDVAAWRARLLPDEKAQVVADLATRGPVLMVGDGINDGPALAAASVGLAMADSGNAVAMEAADGALMHRDLALVPYAIALGRAAVRTVRVNVALALALKVAVIIAAAAGAASLWLAVLADVGASLLVVALSLRLLSFEPVREGRT